METDNFFYVIFSLLLILCSSAFIQNQPATWISQPDGNSKWVFSSDSTTKIYLNGNLEKSFTYSISGADMHCGYNVHDYLTKHHNMKVLELSDVQSDEKKCYFIFGLNQEHLSLRYFGSKDLLFFKRQ